MLSVRKGLELARNSSVARLYRQAGIIACAALAACTLIAGISASNADGAFANDFSNVVTVAVVDGVEVVDIYAPSSAAFSPWDLFAQVTVTDLGIAVGDYADAMATPLGIGVTAALGLAASLLIASVVWQWIKSGRGAKAK